MPQITFLNSRFCRQLPFVSGDVSRAMTGHGTAPGGKLVYAGNFEQQGNSILVTLEMMPVLAVKLPGLLG